MTVDLPLADAFAATWPSVAYHELRCPIEAHRDIDRARAQAPVALGPYGPELLSYQLVRTVLRDSRFVMPSGLALPAQGITSGPG